MPASLSAALVLLLLAGTWLLGRRRPRAFLRSTDTADVVALNRAQIERLRAPGPMPPAPAPAAQAPGHPGPGPVPAASLPDPPVSPRLCHQRLRQLRTWLRGSREQRLAALALAGRARRQEALPLLRLALRDPDPAVMAAAAAAMQRFRGRPAEPAAPQPAAAVRRR